MVNLTLVSQTGRPMKDILILIGVTLVVIVLGVWVRQDWIDQCEADGHPRYECEERYDRAHPPAQQVNVHNH